MITFLAFIFVFGMLIFAHELGHFFAARNRGVRVEELAFGFPPRLWSRKKGETVYAINLIPIGGYCKIYGEHGEDGKDPRSYTSKNAVEKAFMLSAGVIANILLAIVLLTIAYAAGMRAYFPGMANHSGVINNQKVKITSVDKDSPAQKEGLLEGDIVRKVEGKEIMIDAEVQAYIVEKTANNPDEKVAIELERNGQTFAKEIQTFADKVKVEDKEVPVRRVGITLETIGNIRAPFYLAPFVAISETFKLAGQFVLGVGQFFTRLVTQLSVSENVIGPVKIVSYTGAFAKLGILPLIQFSAMLSISLAVMNLLPIPALDGGHLFILALEKALRREFSARAKAIVQMMGFTLIIGLVIIITLKDLSIISSIRNLI